MKVGIVIPYSWSYWGGVVDHAEEQADALEQFGIETRLIIGHDPPGRISRLLHPRTDRTDRPPARVIAVGRSVIAPANDSLANIVLSPAAIPRIRRVLERERFDLLHIHEPLTPIIGTAALASARVPVVATFHAAGSSRWRAIATDSWGFLLDRIDVRIAVSQAAAQATDDYSPGEYRVIPNGVRVPATVDPSGRDNTVIFVGRHEPRKGLAVLLAAWPRVYASTGARLRVIGADPPLVRLLMMRSRLEGSGVDLLGTTSAAELDEELRRARLLVAPSLRGESFGMVLIRAFAAGTPVVASDIDGYRQVVGAETGMLVPPGDPEALGTAIVELLADETRRLAFAAAGRATVEAKYSWPRIAAELVGIYRTLCGEGAARAQSTERVRGGAPAQRAATACHRVSSKAAVRSSSDSQDADRSPTA